MSWGYVAVAAGTVAAGAIGADASKDAARGQQAAANQSSLEQQRARQDATVAWDDAFNNSLAAQRSALEQYLPMQERAYQQALAEQQSARDRLYSDSAGYRDAGTNALQQLMAMLNQGAAPTMQDVQNEPGYQFGLQQGKNALEGSAAAKGGLYSGQALKELNQFGNDYASTKYNDAWNRTQQDYSNRWSRISGLVNMGQQENARVSSADQAYANNIGSLAQNNAQRQGSALLDQAGNETALRTNRASALGNLATGTANNLSNIWQNNSNAQGAAALQQGQIYGNGINQLAGLAGNYMKTNTGTNSATNWGAGTSNPWGGTATDPWYG